MLKIILYALLAWFLYNLVFRIVLPVYRTTRQVKKRFDEMRDQMEKDTTRQQTGYAQQPQQPVKKPDTARPAGDYIDYEEVK
jgi:hypothetical protein